MINGLSITPSRYEVKLGDKLLGYCMLTKKGWVFGCEFDGSITFAPTPELAVARCKYLQKHFRQFCDYPGTSGNK